MRNFILFITLITIFPNKSSFAGANDDQWHHYNPAHIGPSGGSVNKFANTDENLLWVATTGGLSLYDGIQWKTLTTTNSPLTDSYIYTVHGREDTLWIGTRNAVIKHYHNQWIVYEGESYHLDDKDVRTINTARDGTLWIGTNSGIVTYDGSSWNLLTPLNSPLPGLAIRDIVIDSLDRLWIGTNEGIAVIDGDKWMIIDHTNSPLNERGAPLIRFDSQNAAWIGQRYTMFRYWNGQWETYHMSDLGFVNNFVYDFAIDENDVLWMAGSQGIITHKNNEWNLLDINISEYSGSSTVVFVDNHNVKWFGSMGVLRYDAPEWTYFTYQNTGFTGSEVTAIAIENADRIYFGTKTKGFVEYIDGVWKLYYSMNSDLPSDRITTLTHDQTGILWIGTESDGIILFDGAKWFFYTQENSCLPSDNIRVLTNHPTGGMLIGSDAGLTYFNKNNQCVTYNYQSTGLLITRVEAISIAGDHTWWVGTESTGLFHFSGERWTWFNTDNSHLQSNEINAVIGISENHVYIGTNGGYYEYKNDQWTTYREINSDLPSNRVNALALDQNDIIWIGTRNGLVRFDGSSMEIFTAQNSGLNGNEISVIATDEHNNKWISVVWVYGVSVYNEGGVTEVIDRPETVPQSFALYQNFPNPFNARTTIRYSISEPGIVQLELFDSIGRYIKTFTNEYQTTGDHIIYLDAQDLPSGVYYYRLRIGDQSKTKRFILLK